MPNPLLSICIPTFKRAKYLSKTLNDLSTLITKDLENKVEVIVSDNCSPDNTSEVIKNFENKFRKFTSIRNDQNYGYDYNYLQCVSRSSGEYIWVFSDDDHFVENSVSRLIKILEKRDVCTVILNRSISENYPCYPVYGARMYDVKEDTRGTLLELSREFGLITLLGLVSGVVIKNPSLHASDWIRHMNYESALAHISVNLECYSGMPALITNEDFLHIETPLEHAEKGHQAKQDPRINFNMWSLNITKFFIDCINRGIIRDDETDQFYLILHCKMSLANHIISSIENCVSEAREINLNEWEKIKSFLTITKNISGLERINKIQKVHDKLLEQVYAARVNEGFKSMVYSHINNENL